MTDFLRELRTDLDAAHSRRATRTGPSRARATLLAGATAATVAVILLVGSSIRSADPPEKEAAPPATAGVLTARTIPCAVGQRPTYFVPAPAGDPPTLIGCARLPVSNRRVEFSAQREVVGGSKTTCINPAYGGGAYIPTVCRLDPRLASFAVRNIGVPGRRPSGYGYVIWGTTKAAADVLVRFNGGVARAAAFEVSTPLARSFGEKPFGVFIAELPESARCSPVTVESDESTREISIPECTRDRGQP